jgi:hypothetical protein
LDIKDIVTETSRSEHAQTDESKLARELKLSAVEQELLDAEIRAFRASLPDPTARERYEELAAMVDEGSVAAERLDQLTTILEIGLQTGRLRRVYGPDGEMALGRIYQRTPRGAAASTEAAAVTRALGALAGQEIDEVRVTALGPGSYSIVIDTRRCQVTVRLDRAGVRVDSVALGV